MAIVITVACDLEYGAHFDVRNKKVCEQTTQDSRQHARTKFKSNRFWTASSETSFISRNLTEHVLGTGRFTFLEWIFRAASSTTRLCATQQFYNVFGHEFYFVVLTVSTSVLESWNYEMAKLFCVFRCPNDDLCQAFHGYYGAEQLKMKIHFTHSGSVCVTTSSHQRKSGSLQIPFEYFQPADSWVGEKSRRVLASRYVLSMYFDMRGAASIRVRWIG